MKRITRVFASVLAVGVGALLLNVSPAAAQWANGTEKLPAEDVRNTKHNFFLNQDVGYSEQETTEVCVFCHTPHGGRNTTTASNVPLWNRAMPTASTVYEMYDSPNFDGSASWAVTGGQPKGVSLACLSCHDGTIGIDALINAPGSGGFVPGNKGNDATLYKSLGLNGGVRALGVDATDGSMTEDQRPDCTTVIENAGTGKNACFHFPMGPQTNSEFFAGWNGTDVSGTFGMAPFPNLTTVLSDDHPISMQIPANDPQFAEITANFLNSNADGVSGVSYLSRTGTHNTDVRDRLRAYPTGGSGTQYVECASCHNPHTPRPLFLRLPNATNSAGTITPLDSGGGITAWSAITGNTGDSTYVSNNPNFQSAICLSCHEK
ncbi:MAG: hypothetical protein ACE5FN_02790 [Leptospirillia bacterium]